jgi:hypothetical protein
MGYPIIRIKEIELQSIKNIEYGKIDLQSPMLISNKSVRADIMGIYGQNGSGKTAFVDAMWIIKYLLSGKELPKNTGDYILETEQSAMIKLSFYLNNRYQVFYEVEIEKNDENRVIVTRELLSHKELIDGVWKNKAGIIDYRIKYKEDIFKPQKNYKLLISKNADVQIDLGVAKKMSGKNSTSFIFSSELEEIIKKNKGFKQYTNIILALKHYANINLFIIKNHNTGMVNMNVLIPFSFRLIDENKITQGDLAIGILEPTIIPKEVYDIVIEIIEQMNIVLETMVPGFNIGLKIMASK